MIAPREEGRGGNITEKESREGGEMAMKKCTLLVRNYGRQLKGVAGGGGR